MRILLLLIFGIDMKSLCLGKIPEERRAASFVGVNAHISAILI
jgi:hypothetical protein